MKRWLCWVVSCLCAFVRVFDVLVVQHIFETLSYGKLTGIHISEMCD